MFPATVPVLKSSHDPFQARPESTIRQESRQDRDRSESGIRFGRSRRIMRDAPTGVGVNAKRR